MISNSPEDQLEDFYEILEFLEDHDDFIDDDYQEEEIQTFDKYADEAKKYEKTFGKVKIRKFFRNYFFLFEIFHFFRNFSFFF